MLAYLFYKDKKTIKEETLEKSEKGSTINNIVIPITIINDGNKYITYISKSKIFNTLWNSSFSYKCYTILNSK